MKKYLFLFAVIIPLVSIYGTQITKTFIFNENELSFRQEQNYDIVLLKDCLTTTKFGEQRGGLLGAGLEVIKTSLSDARQKC